ncbi:DEAD/DEAH box helicase family protein [Rheinheimera sp. UJ51]|uniref:DEAD/DEAH box helicase family protein n=1 Tax=Rheinheimera sp. UJ51 TaxID=2892446 RepID=UPI001E541E3F|nr:DEAD/DEAH box helicase family protein [Rheinheimera sp. UJ51]MCC5452865.1 DEAD/DEAH box helicase family protein [Rheinheimera sp. UJ51]
MKLVDIKFPDNFEYSSDTKNLPIEFYLQAFPRAKTVYLKLGYFSSSAIKLLAYGFAQFIYRGGNIKIVTNHFLYKSDINLLEQEDISSQYDEELLLADLNWLHDSLTSESTQFLNCLKYLVNQGRLELIPVMLIPNRMSHYKQGIFIDSEENAIFIDGSCNFTANGILENGENISVFRSWGGGFERNKVRDKTKDIIGICGKENKQYKYLKADQVLNAVSSLGNEKTIEDLLTDEVALLNEYNIRHTSEIIKVYKKELEVLISEEKLKPKFPFNSLPRNYQIEAYESWIENDMQGIFAMATGTGKTITSLNCLLNLYKSEGIYQAIILVPSKTLLNQWAEEVALFNFSNVYLVSSDYKWKKNLNQLATQLSFDVKTSFILISTYKTFSSEGFSRYINALPNNTLLIADEAHNIGSAKMKLLLPDLNFKKRLALSATPKRKFDEEGNELIEKFFNSQEPYTYSFSMEKAIKQGILCSYEYYPKLITLTEDELERYIEISKKLAKFFDNNTKKFIKSDALEKLLLARKRIIHKAENKKLAFKSILTKHLSKQKGLSYSFVYVPEGESHDGKNIMNDYLSVLNELSPNTRAYAFTGETKNKKEVMERFEQGLIESLFSMKCLDEGVDIPRAELAIFCSSTGNPRQFIQRRGRILRKHPEKDYSTIYDLVVMPSHRLDESTFNIEKNLVKEELIRVIYFASLAKNYYEAMEKFEQIASLYDLDLYAIHNELGEH